MAKLITPRAEDYSRWYTDVVTQSRMADYSPVKGCMVIRPHGYAHLGEHAADARPACSRRPGHENAYFPLFIPKSFLAKEAAARRGLRQGVRDRHAHRPEGGDVDGKTSSIRTRRASSRRSCVIRPTSRDDHLAHVREVDRSRTATCRC